MRIREAGDSALVLELVRGASSSASVAPDVDVNARVIAIARAFRARAMHGVREVTSTFRSVAVYFDPLSTDVEAVMAGLDEDANATSPAPPGRTIEVPVVYGGEAGPDLARVADFAGCSPEVVIERHAARTYRVFMLGFLPGFAYMASVDESIAAPRHATPRLRVAAGSVGIAGRQTGVYPCDSSGGWQIIGRTATRVFDVDSAPPALFAPGDEVRFVRIPAEEAAFEVADVSGPPRPAGKGSRCVTVVRPGLLTTVQDAGRWGYQAFGVSVAGPMDPVAHRLANSLVGNGRDASTLEATWIGPDLRVEQETLVAIAGGDLGTTLDGAEVPPHASVRCSPGSMLRFAGRRSGARSYIAFDGGITVPLVFGSRATHVASHIGGVHGRALRAGDCLPLGHARSGSVPAAHPSSPELRTPNPEPRAPSPEPRTPSPEFGGGARLRVLPGPQVELFGPSALESLRGVRYTVSPNSDRMGYRLTGGVPIRCAASGDMISDAAFVGAVQVPPSGDPILLMADRQTTGGYPQLAIVITADLPLAGQLAPGDWVEFDPCSRADAIAALAAQEGWHDAR